MLRSCVQTGQLDTSLRAIRRSFLKFALKNHPDKNPDSANATRAFQAASNLKIALEQKANEMWESVIRNPPQHQDNLARTIQPYRLQFVMDPEDLHPESLQKFEEDIQRIRDSDYRPVYPEPDWHSWVMALANAGVARNKMRNIKYNSVLRIQGMESESAWLNGCVVRLGSEPAQYNIAHASLSRVVLLYTLKVSHCPNQPRVHLNHDCFESCSPFPTGGLERDYVYFGGFCPACGSSVLCCSQKSLSRECELARKPRSADGHRCIAPSSMLIKEDALVPLLENELAMTVDLTTLIEGQETPRRRCCCSTKNSAVRCLILKLAKCKHATLSQYHWAYRHHLDHYSNTKEGKCMILWKDWFDSLN
eukprot:TRINITY_DN27405_c0_g2_i1.p1 TRINITY_DN27405_c0_g2~~TRINITY_DN27405_c0_g2_i1.p1  ORF type:complete len:427 (+),score=40.18 TRINITY_DN27405_c0_g2_i1:190-1281(+)